jgi:ferritin
MGMKLISENLIDSLLAQWAHEKYNAHLYLYISSFLKNKGLNHLGNKFYNQYKEENEHLEY